MAEASDHPAFSETALVIVGHGSGRNPDSSRPTRLHADTIRARGLFAEVHCGFWKEAPFLAEVLDSVTAERVVVVPNLACKGFITGTVIPREMGLEEEARAGVRLADPVGTHPRIAEAVAERARSVIAGEGLDPADVCFLLVGHGSTRDTGSYLQTQQIADQLGRLGLAAEVRAAFLEQDPKLEDWRDTITAPNLVVMPFMISNGLHGAEDIPEMLGLNPADAALRSMAETGVPAGPFEVHGKRVWYCRAVGNEPAVADIIVDLARAALD